MSVFQHFWPGSIWFQPIYWNSNSFLLNRINDSAFLCVPTCQLFFLSLNKLSWNELSTSPLLSSIVFWCYLASCLAFSFTTIFTLAKVKNKATLNRKYCANIVTIQGQGLLSLYTSQAFSHQRYCCYISPLFMSMIYALIIIQAMKSWLQPEYLFTVWESSVSMFQRENSYCKVSKYLPEPAQCFCSSLLACHPLWLLCG